MVGPSDALAPVGRDPVITPAYPSDLDALIALFCRSSDVTRRERFHGSVRRIPSQYLRDILCGAPGVIARVARDLTRDPSGGCIVALASASPESDVRAELAVWVVDDRQRHGIGTRVVRAVLEQLRADGVPTAVAYVAADNHAAISLARRAASDLGVAVAIGPHITFDIGPDLGELTA